MEFWASPEPTVARIDAQTVRDQLAETGHEEREEDIERLATLGITATRYPVLWEKVCPTAPTDFDFLWTDRRLELLARQRIEPIITLLHHGSGPPFTSLVDPNFPHLFAAYAREVARRYPFVRRWTPINEPLTTARFSTLYGFWYPNGCFDHQAFGRAIVNESLGIVLAIRAIRETIPIAELVLTEDLQGFRAAGPDAQSYADHKSERRFLAAELVMGRVGRGHALWPYLVDVCAVPVALLENLLRAAVSIDLMGWNYYPLSERVVSRTGSAYQNVALVDIDPRALNPRARLREAAQRLGVPIALSEVHCFGHEQERARWLLQRYEDACALRDEGFDVHAVGAWAAFGMVDWRSLLRERAGTGEDGVFTYAGRFGTPRFTYVGQILRELIAGQVPRQPVEPGWWERVPDAVA